jgi:vancomycin permeability regulator SanA
MEIIFVLGYTLNEDGTIREMLKNRLEDTFKLYKADNTRQIIVTGAIPYTETRIPQKSQAEVMKEYLINKGINQKAIIIEDKSQSSVEQLCWLHEQIDLQKLASPSKIIVIANEFFDKRVEVYCKYILGPNIKFEVFGSQVPKDVRDDFAKVEADKTLKAINWLQNIEPGNYKQILNEQLSFLQKIVKKEVDYPMQKKL